MTELESDFEMPTIDVAADVVTEPMDVTLPGGIEPDPDSAIFTDEADVLTEFGTLVDDSETDSARYGAPAAAIGNNVMARAAVVDVVAMQDDTTEGADDSGADVNEAADEAEPQVADHSEHGEPPDGGEHDLEGLDEEDRRAKLAQRYAEKFAPNVAKLRGELTQKIFENHEFHPGFVAYDLADPWIANFQIASTDNPSLDHGVRLPMELANKRANNSIEERRLEAFLHSDDLQHETKASMVQIEAFDPETHMSITEAPGIPMHVVPRSMWTAIARPETLTQLRDALVDMADHNITVLDNYSIMFWNPERERIVLGNYVPEVEPDDGEEVPSALERGMERFRREAYKISQMCPRAETARIIRARTNELYDELIEEPMYLRLTESNMPELEVVTGGRDGARVQLPDAVQDEIVARTMQVEEVPAYPAIRSDEQLLLDGLAHGLSQQKIADAAGKTREDMVDIAREVKDWLGMPDQPSVLYRALLHHSIDISPPEVQVTRPILTTNEAVHFYLASIGYSKAEAAAMVGVAEGTVKRHRDSVLRKFQARSMPQAIAHAFACRYYKSFPPPEGNE